jgi:hypothetical protein
MDAALYTTKFRPVQLQHYICNKRSIYAVQHATAATAASTRQAPTAAARAYRRLTSAATFMAVFGTDATVTTADSSTSAASSNSADVAAAIEANSSTAATTTDSASVTGATPTIAPAEAAVLRVPVDLVKHRQLSEQSQFQSQFHDPDGVATLCIEVKLSLTLGMYYAVACSVQTRALLDCIVLTCAPVTGPALISGAVLHRCHFVTADTLHALSLMLPA